ncbi:MAG: acyltransferase [Porphyromonas sp.]|nr:acyltransferase [Porphyromonas sp.]
MSNTHPSKRQPIASLYVLKALCALGVVILHAPLGWTTDSLRLLASVTVPIFYMITGYFLYTEDERKVGDRLSGSIRKLVIILLILNVALTLMSLDSIPPLNDWVLWVKWLILGQHYTYAHLWYLMAGLEALVLFWVMNKLGLTRFIPWLMALWLLKFVFEDYRPLLFGEPASMLAANAVFYAIPCIAAGWFVRKHQELLLRCPYLGLSLVLSIAIAFVVRFGLSDAIEPQATWQILLTPIARTFMIISIFLFALRHSSYGAGGRMEYLGRELSGNIYYWHGCFITLCAAVLPAHIYDNFGALFVAVLSILFAQVVVSLQRKLGVNYLP